MQTICLLFLLNNSLQGKKKGNWGGVFSVLDGSMRSLVQKGFRLGGGLL